MEEFEYLTIKQLRELQGFTEEVLADTKVPLSVWYRSIQNKKLIELDDGDIAKLIRQNRNLIYVIPHALQRLERNPMLGEIYEGELLIAFKSVRLSFWSENPSIYSLVISFFERFLADEIKIPDDFEWGYPEHQPEFYDQIRDIFTTLKSC